MASPGLESALIIEVPQAEAAVHRYRERFDANAPLGIPAHITVLAPFMPPHMINAPALTQLGQLFADIGPFQFRLDRTGWFSDHVLWLGLDNPGPFRDLTQHVFQEFPAFPPFEAKHDVLVPHLTVGYGHPLTDLRAAEEAIQDSPGSYRNKPAKRSSNCSTSGRVIGSSAPGASTTGSSER
jgi:2'-5' RNA ligase